MLPLPRRLLAFLVALPALHGATPAADPLAADFAEPPVAARPYVWWHWMGPNFSQEGITKDLEAMQAAGIGGATLFNLASAVQETQAPTTHNPWPHQTYRSPAHWAALRHAAGEARRLGLELGLHNTVGYSTTGGPWIDEERGIQKVVWRSLEVDAGPTGGAVDLPLPRPEAPKYSGYGSLGQTTTFYRDIGVVAVPAGGDPVALNRVLDLSAHLGADQHLRWTAPAGRWQVLRFGHAPTGIAPHPVPDDVIGRVLEADKLSLEQTRHHWGNVLDPIATELGVPVGRHLAHFLIDSYEAGHQSWTTGFREEFRRRKGYDPLPWLPTLGTPITGEREPKQRRLIGDETLTARFEHDYREVVSDLYYENGWRPAAERIRAAGATLQFEPYTGPFDLFDGAALADLPMGEFWTGGRGGIDTRIVAAARAAGRRIVGAEAFTGRPEISQWTETPALLKRSADGTFGSGVNRLVLHHWVHQPFPDRHQPGMGMGWWGTHFGRHQTWFEPGAEFFRYLGRVQVLLQRGETPVAHLSVGAAEAGGDAISWRAFRQDLQVRDGRLWLPSGRTYRLLSIPHPGALEPADIHRIGTLVRAGAAVIAPRPLRAPGLAGYPACDTEVAALAAELWGDAPPPVSEARIQPAPPPGPLPAPRSLGAGRLYPHSDIAAARRALGLAPFVELRTTQPSDIRTHHRRDGPVDLVFVANLEETPRAFTATFALTDRAPELWDAETGTCAPAPLWRIVGDRTEVTLRLGAAKSVFVVFRAPVAPGADHATYLTTTPADAAWTFAPAPDRTAWILTSDTPFAAEIAFASGRRETRTFAASTATPLHGPWRVSFASPVDQITDTTLPALAPLAEHPLPTVRHFAGTATYHHTFSVEAVSTSTRTVLDLGDVQAIARVSLNGHDLGVLWHPPFHVDVTAALRPGANELAVAVSTTWHNRLVGDEQEPADFEWGKDRGPTMGRALAGYPEWFLKDTPRPSAGRKAFVIWYYHRTDTPLRPAGLLGPVMLRDHPPN